MGCDAEYMLYKKNEELFNLRAILNGLSQEAIDGGWTFTGMSEYTKKLEKENSSLKMKVEILHKVKADNSDEITISMLNSEIDCKREDIINLVSALREIYSMRGEDGFIERVVNGAIDNLRTIV